MGHLYLFVAGAGGAKQPRHQRYFMTEYHRSGHMINFAERAKSSPSQQTFAMFVATLLILAGLNASKCLYYHVT